MAQNMNLSFIEGPLWSKLYNVQCKIINSYCVTKRIFILKFYVTVHLVTWALYEFLFLLNKNCFWTPTQLIHFICGRRQGGRRLGE